MKKTVLWFLCTILSVVFFSCKERCCCEDYDLGIHIFIFDKDSCDLLNPNNPKGYKESEIALYQDPDLKEKLFNVDVLPLDKDSIYCIHLMAPMDYKENDKLCATSYLKLNDTTIDTIYTEITETECSHTVSKIIYNGKDVDRSFTVVK